MIFTALFDPIRRDTVDALSAACTAASVHVEPAYRTADGALALDGVWNLPCRSDFIPTQGISAGTPTNIASPSKQDFDCRDIPLESGFIRLCPFSWGALTLRIIGIDSDQAQAVLAPWFRRWFDENDNNSITPEGLYGVAHFMSDPEPVDGAIEVQIDLGSVPEAALEELLHSLTDGGASQMHLS